MEIQTESVWLQRMLGASQDVFQSMLGVPVERIDSAGARPPGLTAIVSLAGSPSGVLSISCESAAAARIAMRMLGSAAPEPDDNAIDALGELSNMVAGGVKSRISTSEDLCRLSVPTVISGDGYCVRPMVDGERYEIVLDVCGDCVAINLEIHDSSP